MLDNKKKLNIVRAIIALANCLGIKVIAEGVESLEQAKMLIDEGCTIMQGYFFAKPMPWQEFEEHLQNKIYMKQLG